MNQLKPHRFAVIVALVSFVGALSLPYGYYQFLRVAVCSWAIWAITVSWKSDQGPARWALIALALLYNPICPVQFTKFVWASLDVTTGFVLLWYTYRGASK